MPWNNNQCTLAMKLNDYVWLSIDIIYSYSYNNNHCCVYSSIANGHDTVIFLLITVTVTITLSMQSV